MKLGKAISDVQSAETDMAKELRAIGERHAVERDLYHLGHTLARQCAEHLERLAPFADRYGGGHAGDSVGESPRILETLRRRCRRPGGESTRRTRKCRRYWVEVVMCGLSFPTGP